MRPSRCAKLSREAFRRAGCGLEALLVGWRGHEALPKDQEGFGGPHRVTGVVGRGQKAFWMGREGSVCPIGGPDEFGGPPNESGGVGRLFQ